MLKCRCHGISGSCSLQSCWHVLPDFHQIGAYLKKKYDTSIHLPYAINLNKLIPLMDRSEIGAILAAQNESSNFGSQINHVDAKPMLVSDNSQGPAYDGPLSDQPSIAPPTATPTQQPQRPRFLLSGHLILPQNITQNKQQIATTTTSTSTTTTTTTTTTTQKPELAQDDLDSDSISMQHESDDDTAADRNEPETDEQDEDNQDYAAMDENLLHNLSPITRDQYQSLLRDLRLCSGSNYYANHHQHHHNNHTKNNNNRRHLRQVNHIRSLNGKNDHNNNNLQNRLQIPFNQLNNNELTTNQQENPNRILKSHPHQHQHHLLHTKLLNQYFLKFANQHLSSVLQLNREDLIHLHKSPEYCKPNSNHGFAGIEARVCNPLPGEPDSCDKLCCGRGYTTNVYKYWRQCDCKFKYCCDVVCSECQREEEQHVCR